MSREAPLGRPPGFSYRAVKKGLGLRRSTEALLHCEEVPVSKLVERFDTPLYVYSASTIRERMDAGQYQTHEEVRRRLAE